MVNKKQRSKAAKRGWETRRANSRKRSDAAKRGWKTRRSKEGIGTILPKRKKVPTEWYVKYHVKSSHGKKKRKAHPFNGELIFETTRPAMNSEKANGIAAKILSGETPRDVKFKQFSYNHGKVSKQRIISEFNELDMMDFDFLIYDGDDDAYVESSGKR